MKISTTGTITIYKHVGSKPFISQFVEIEHKCDDTISIKQFETIEMLHYEYMQFLIDLGAFNGYIFVSPDHMVPGKTAHFSSEFYVRLIGLKGVIEEFCLDGMDVTEDETEDREIAIGIISEHENINKSKP